MMLFVMAAQAAGDRDDFYHMKNRGAEFWQILESLPYASEGVGPVMYLFEYSECPYCQRMYRDFNGVDTGMEQRKIFVPINEKTAREAAALGKSRSISDYHAYMTSRKTAPDFRQDNAAIDAINSVIAGTTTLEEILQQNQWPLAGIRFPQYVWKENGRVFTNAGYSKESFSKAIARNIAGNAQTASASSTTRLVPSTGMTERSPKLEENDIQGVKLTMTPAQIQHHLSTSGWQQRGMQWSKDDGSKKTIVITLSRLVVPGEETPRVESIVYMQQLDRNSTVLDLSAVKSALEQKYGVSDHWTVSTPSRRGGGASIDDPQGKLSMTFNAFQNVPEIRDLTQMCKAALQQGGMSVLQSNQRAAGTLYHPNGTVPPPPNAYDNTRRLCPETIPFLLDIQKSLIAPTLSVTAFRQGANINLELKWTKPTYDYAKANQDARMEKQNSRRSTGNIDL